MSEMEIRRAAGVAVGELIAEAERRGEPLEFRDLLIAHLAARYALRLNARLPADPPALVDHYLGDEVDA